MREYARAKVAVVTRTIHKMVTKKASPFLLRGLSKFGVFPAGAGQEGPSRYAWISAGILIAHWIGSECAAM